MELLTAEVSLPLSTHIVGLSEGTGYTDRVLLKKGKRIHELLPEYLLALTKTINGEKPKLADILNLLVPDFEFLLIEAYKLNYGDILEFNNVCAECGKVTMQSFDMSTLPMLPLPKACSGPPDPTLDLVLPRAKKRARVGFMTVQNDMIFNETYLSSGQADLNQGDFLSLRMLEGVDPISYEEVIRLPLMDHKALRKKRRELQAGYDTLVTVQCEHCSAYDVVNVLGLRDFLFPSG